MLKHKTFTVIITVLLSVLLFTCIAFAACGEEPAPSPEPEPTPTPSTSVVTKSFTFTPEFGGEYIFFDNIYFEELYVTTNGEEIYPSADGEYRLTSRTTYVISFKGCKELSYELTYDISDDREVTLAPGEERIVKLGKMYDEIKTVTTGNNNIKITGIYRGMPDDLKEYDYSPDIPATSCTVPLKSGDEYYVTVINDSNNAIMEGIILNDIERVSIGDDGTAEFNVRVNKGVYSYVCLADIPAGNYMLEVNGLTTSSFAVYDEYLEYVPSSSYGSDRLSFDIDARDRIYIRISGQDIETACRLYLRDDTYQWRINSEITRDTIYYAEQGTSFTLDLLVNDNVVDGEFSVSGTSADKYGYDIDGNIISISKDSFVDGGSFTIDVSYGIGAVYYYKLTVIPVLAEPFTGVTFETLNGRTLMTWENVPNLYSFAYSINGGEERKVLAGENTSIDITSYLPENTRRALVEITDVTYSYPEYDVEGSPTGETRKVTHDDVMKFVAEL